MKDLLRFVWGLILLLTALVLCKYGIDDWREGGFWSCFWACCEIILGISVGLGGLENVEKSIN